MAKKVARFFSEIEAIWSVIPGYAKVFLYSTISSTFGLWVAGQLDFRAIAIVVATNLGIYQVPRSINRVIQK